MNSKTLNKIDLRHLSICALLLAGIQGGAQNNYSSTIFNHTTPLPMTPFSAVWKQSLHHRITAGYEFHRKENSQWFQQVRIRAYNHLVPSVFPAHASTLTERQLFFYTINQAQSKELDYYPFSKNQNSAFSTLYKVSGLSYLDQRMRNPKLNVWLPSQAEKLESREFVGALLYTALSVYSTLNQPASNSIGNPNITIIKH